MTDEYIDPNSGKAAQPGGYASVPLVATDSEDAGKSPDTDAVKDAAIEHEASDLGAGQNVASESGTTKEDVEAGTAPEQNSGDAQAADQEQGGEEEKTEEEPAKAEEPKKDYSELLAQSLPPIQEYLAAHPDEVDAVKAAEIDRAGDDARKGVLNYGDE